MILRLRSFRKQLVFYAILSSGILVIGQPTTHKKTTVNPADPQGILNELAPNDVPPRSLALKPLERVRAIRLLVAVKRDETEWHRQLAVYLLASLDYDYQRNLDELLRAWKSAGDDGTMELLIGLYNQGHKELLKPLLAGFSGWNAAASEGLGSFFSDQLQGYPQDFLNALATFPPEKQLYLCTAAGETDGGGMGEGAERKVLANLKRIGGEVAARCARGVRTGNQSADAANHEEQTVILGEAPEDKSKKKAE